MFYVVYVNKDQRCKLCFLEAHLPAVKYHATFKANSSCAEAKANLEMMCQDLSNELDHFDLRKERELREILMEYSALRSEHFEKVQSKWFGVKFMVEAPISVDVRAVKCVEESTWSSPGLVEKPLKSKITVLLYNENLPIKW